MVDLIAARLAQFAPTTNLYRLADGRCVLVTVPDADLPMPPGLAAVLGAVSIDTTAPSPTEVFLADEHGALVDADGDPANGLTPILRCAPGTTHEQAIAELLEAESP